MKPDLATAMGQLLNQLRTAIPFNTPTEQLCDGACRGCAKKLLEFLDMELEQWEQQLALGVQPTFGDIERLAKRGHKIYRALQGMGLIKS
ncbi:MAG: hypothetical protein OIF34_02290 [Porticoccaceae bacterium]|nr:hypothetical protein [Porticoccaceae bacterium]